MVKITKALITKLTKNPIPTLDTLSEEDVAQIIQKANYEYRNSKTTMFSDDLFDLIKDYLEMKNPNHPILNSIGAAATRDKVELPFFMGSLDKIKNDDKLVEKFKVTYTCSYVVSDKLDGNSALYYTDNEGKPFLFTRGDGSIGQDISHLLPFIANIPKADTKVTAVRGELIISRKDFETVKDKGANARNMVAGIINAKLPDLEIAKLVQFVAYELINPRHAPENQFDIMEKMGFKAVFHKTFSDQALNNSLLSDILVNRRKGSPYEVDGIVVMHNAMHNRVKDNPKYAFAFKSVHTMDKAEVVVTNIDWNISKDGYIIPVVQFNPVHLAGVTIQKANGFNGKYINDNKLGPGSRIIIMRSGDVIPYIVEVLTPSATGKPSMPELQYDWNKSGVDIIVKQGVDGNDDMKLKTIEYFFNKLDIKGVSTGTIAKIFKAGFQDVRSITKITVQDLLKIDGFQIKSAEKIYSALQDGVKDVDCVTLMDASNTLGRGMGSKKIVLIVDAFPTILTKKYVPSIDELIVLKGIEKKTAEVFIQNLPAFFSFYETCGIKCGKVVEEVTPISTKYSGMTFVFTGFRSKELEDHITSNGGVISGTLNKKTTTLVVKDKDGKESSKIQKVKEIEDKNNIKIKVVSKDEFMTAF
jgi:DNA ligase (NAD+)